jgi:hypothetical protein
MVLSFVPVEVEAGVGVAARTSCGRVVRALWVAARARGRGVVVSVVEGPGVAAVCRLGCEGCRLSPFARAAVSVSECWVA